jgi:pectate lyase
LTPGGRGGRVIEVTSLADAGPGTLREAIEAQGPRIVVFRVAGEIASLEPLVVREPFLTLAGQSAPGGGITVRDASLLVSTHDVIIRGIRARRGDAGLGAITTTGADSFAVYPSQSDVYNIIVDHCSFGWGIDESASIAGKALATDVTFQWNIIAETLSCVMDPPVPPFECPHSRAMLVTDADRISIHHNLYAHHETRSPRIAGGAVAEVVANVVYDWSTWGTQVAHDGQANVIDNCYLAGPATPRGKPPIQADPSSLVPRLYVTGNVGPEPLVAGPEYLVAEPVLAPSGILAHAPCDELAGVVLDQAGAIVPHRDAADARIVADVENGTGGIIDHPSEVGGYPQLEAAAAPPDTDHDGMPDTWETDRGLDPADPDDASGDDDGDGYTNVEEYLNGLIPLPACPG